MSAFEELLEEATVSIRRKSGARPDLTVPRDVMRLIDEAHALLVQATRSVVECRDNENRAVEHLEATRRRRADAEERLAALRDADAARRLQKLLADLTKGSVPGGAS